MRTIYKLLDNLVDFLERKPDLDSETRKFLWEGMARELFNEKYMKSTPEEYEVLRRYVMLHEKIERYTTIRSTDFLSGQY